MTQSDLDPKDKTNRWIILAMEIVKLVLAFFAGSQVGG